MSPGELSALMSPPVRGGLKAAMSPVGRAHVARGALSAHVTTSERRVEGCNVARAFRVHNPGRESNSLTSGGTRVATLVVRLGTANAIGAVVFSIAAEGPFSQLGSHDRVPHMLNNAARGPGETGSGLGGRCTGRDTRNSLEVCVRRRGLCASGPGRGSVQVKVLVDVVLRSRNALHACGVAEGVNHTGQIP